MAAFSKNARILVTGGTGLIGTNLYNRLIQEDYESYAIGSEYDLRNPQMVKQAFEDFKPTVIFHLAARVGGIYANSNYKADFYSDNVLINTNVINEAIGNNIDYVFAMGTGCAYPKRLEGSILKEETFLDGIPEVTNDAYAYAKRGLLVHLNALLEGKILNFCYCIPANIYGSHDNFHPTHSHVVPGLVRRFCEARLKQEDSVTIWGDGSAKRDFLYIDDCVDAMILLAQKNFSGAVNVATGQLTSIRDLAITIKEASGFLGHIKHDLSYPAGQRERLFDMSKMDNLGWKPKYSLKEGIQKTINWFFDVKDNFRERKN